MPVADLALKAMRNHFVIPHPESENPQAIRRIISLERECEVFETHCHEVDHSFIVLEGEADFQTWSPGRDALISESKGVKPGDAPIIVDAAVWHCWKARVPNTIIACDFPNGERQLYTGSPA